MKNQKFVIKMLCLCTVLNTKAQIQVEWHPDYVVKLEDFRANPPIMANDDQQRSHFACSMGFGYSMTTEELMYSKDFNRYVSNSFVPTASWIEPGDHTGFLVAMAQLNFDLTELYARKLRKRLYENKGIPNFSDFAQKEFTKISNEYAYLAAQIESDIMSVEHKAAKLNEWMTKTRIEINELPDFCKECKIPKPKKKKRKKSGVN